MHRFAWIVAAAAILTVVQSPAPTRAMINFDSGMFYLDYNILVPALVVAPDKPGTVSIVIDGTYYDGSPGINTVAFGIDGLPSDWFVFVQADPSLTIGGGLNGGQLVVQFPSCQTLQPDQSIVLLQLVIVATSVVDHQWIRIVNGGTIDPYSWPVFLSCDPAASNPTPGGQLILNPYTVGVETTSWSTIKGLYRE